jgi:hypothetical protein
MLNALSFNAVDGRPKPAGCFFGSGCANLPWQQQAVPITQTTSQAKAFLIPSWAARRIEK